MQPSQVFKVYEANVVQIKMFFIQWTNQFTTHRHAQIFYSLNMVENKSIEWSRKGWGRERGYDALVAIHLRGVETDPDQKHADCLYSKATTKIQVKSKVADLVKTQVEECVCVIKW